MNGSTQSQTEATFATWRYSVRGVPGVLYLVSPDPIDREDALRRLEQHYGRANILTLEGGAR